MARGVGDKLIRRHPHVFGESDATDTESVRKQWEAIKLQEKVTHLAPASKMWAKGFSGTDDGDETLEEGGQGGLRLRQAGSGLRQGER